MTSDPGPGGRRQRSSSPLVGNHQEPLSTTMNACELQKNQMRSYFELPGIAVNILLGLEGDRGSKRTLDPGPGGRRQRSSSPLGGNHQELSSITANLYELL
jgi:hypothetical protein